MQTHDITIKLTVTARDGISREDIERDLPWQLMALQEQRPYRGTEGAGWWINSHTAVTLTAQEEAETAMPYPAGTDGVEGSFCTGCDSHHDPADCGYNPVNFDHAI